MFCKAYLNHLHFSFVMTSKELIQDLKNDLKGKLMN